MVEHARLDCHHRPNAAPAGHVLGESRDARQTGRRTQEARAAPAAAGKHPHASSDPDTSSAGPAAGSRSECRQTPRLRGRRVVGWWGVVVVGGGGWGWWWWGGTIRTSKCQDSTREIRGLIHSPTALLQPSVQTAQQASGALPDVCASTPRLLPEWGHDDQVGQRRERRFRLTRGAAAHHHKVQHLLQLLLRRPRQRRQLKLLLDALPQAHAVGDLLHGGKRCGDACMSSSSDGCCTHQAARIHTERDTQTHADRCPLTERGRPVTRLHEEAVLLDAGRAKGGGLLTNRHHQNVVCNLRGEGKWALSTRAKRIVSS